MHWVWRDLRNKRDSQTRATITRNNPHWKLSTVHQFSHPLFYPTCYGFTNSAQEWIDWLLREDWNRGRWRTICGAPGSTAPYAPWVRRFDVDHYGGFLKWLSPKIIQWLDHFSIKTQVTWGSRMLRTPTCTANSGCIGFRFFHRDSVFVAGGVRQARPSAGAGDQCGEGRNRAARYPMGYLMVRIWNLAWGCPGVIFITHGWHHDWFKHWAGQSSKVIYSYIFVISCHHDSWLMGMFPRVSSLINMYCFVSSFAVVHHCVLLFTVSSLIIIYNHKNHHLQSCVITYHLLYHPLSSL